MAINFIGFLKRVGLGLIILGVPSLVVYSILSENYWISIVFIVIIVAFFIGDSIYNS